MERNQSLRQGALSRLIGVVLLIICNFTYGAEPTSPSNLQATSQEMNALTTGIFDDALDLKQAINDFVHKQSVNDLTTELVVYVSVKSESDETPNKLGLEIKLDGNVLTHNDYDETQINALLKGASHKLYVGNIAPGSHDLVVHITEQNTERSVNNQSALRFEKNELRKTLEFNVSLADGKTPPEIVFTEIR